MHDGACVRQPGVDARIGRDDLIEAKVVAARDVGQGILLRRLGLSGLAEHILTRRQRKDSLRAPQG